MIWRSAGTVFFSDCSQLVAPLLRVVGSRQQCWLSQSLHYNQDLLAAPAGEQSYYKKKRKAPSFGIDSTRRLMIYWTAQADLLDLMVVACSTVWSDQYLYIPGCIAYFCMTSSSSCEWVTMSQCMHSDGSMHSKAEPLQCFNGWQACMQHRLNRGFVQQFVKDAQHTLFGHQRSREANTICKDKLLTAAL